MKISPQRSLYKIPVIGLILCAFGYFVDVSLKLDIMEGFKNIIQSFEAYELDELLFWMIIFSFFIAHFLYEWTNRKIAIERVRVHRTMLYSCNHILRNFLQQARIILGDFERNNALEPETKDLFQQSILEAEKLVGNLSRIEQIDPKNIYNYGLTGKEQSSILPITKFKMPKNIYPVQYKKCEV